MQGITLIRDFNNLIVKLKDDDRAKIFVSYATNLLKKWKEEMIAFEVSSIMFFFSYFFSGRNNNCAREIEERKFPAKNRASKAPENAHRDFKRFQNSFRTARTSAEFNDEQNFED